MTLAIVPTPSEDTEAQLRVCLAEIAAAIATRDAADRHARMLLDALRPLEACLDAHADDAMSALGEAAAIYQRLRRLCNGPTQQRKMLTAVEAADRLNLLRPNGTPRDSFYSLIERIGGVRTAGKWQIAEPRIESYLSASAA